MITRRNFLKATTLAWPSLALSDHLLSFKSWSPRQADAPISKIPTLCNGCGNRCAIFAYVKNNRLWKIEGNPEANGNQGYICPKGHGYIHDLYNPDRIRGPLKKVSGPFPTDFLGAGLQRDRSKDQPYPYGSWTRIYLLD